MNRSKELTEEKNEVAFPFEGDALSEAIRLKIRESIHQIAEEELKAALGAKEYERTENRRGYRHGYEEREITTAFGKTKFMMPRGKMFRSSGDDEEWHSTLIPRYARRCRDVDAALIGMYFGGVNTRKVRQAIRPLLRNSPLSKSTISRLIVRLKEYFESWSKRSLAEEDIRYLFLDAIYVRVRCGRRISKLPMLAAVGVRSNGEKTLLALEVRGSEGEAAWLGFVQELSARGLKPPKLAIVDGSQGLSNALDAIWPKADRQRCAVHKLRNLLSHAPKRLYEEIRSDYHAIVYAEDGKAGHVAYEAFLRKWKKLSEGVAKSLEEAGEELLTFYRYPKSQWKALRTTNAVERLNQEFRRRIKTQSSFPSESSVLVVLFGVVASGMVRMRRIDGYEAMTSMESAGCLDMDDRENLVPGASSFVPATRLPGNFGQSRQIGVVA